MDFSNTYPGMSVRIEKGTETYFPYTTYTAPLEGIVVSVEKHFSDPTLGVLLIAKDGNARAGIYIQCKWQDVVESANIFLETYRRTFQPSPYTPSLGADPEIFLVDKDNNLVPAFQVLPEKGTDRRTGIIRTLYNDGFAAEFQTTAYTCCALHGDSIQAQLAILHKQMSLKDYRLTIKNAFLIPKDMRDELPNERIQLGCGGSLNAYDEPSVLNGLDGREIPWRCAGGHFHFGMDTGFVTRNMKDPSQAKRIVKIMDASVGVAAVSMAEGIDNVARRRYYGRAGEFRLPRHGLEYRVLSNFWLSHPGIQQFVHECARAGFSLGMAQINIFDGSEEEVRHIINTGDVVGAREYIKRNVDAYVKLFNICFQGATNRSRNALGTKRERDVSLATISRSLPELVENPDDIAGNWGLKDAKLWKRHVESENAQWYSAANTLSTGNKLGCLG